MNWTIRKNSYMFYNKSLHLKLIYFSVNKMVDFVNYFIIFKIWAMSILSIFFIFIILFYIQSHREKINIYSYDIKFYFFTNVFRKSLYFFLANILIIWLIMTYININKIVGNKFWSCGNQIELEPHYFLRTFTSTLKDDFWK